MLICENCRNIYREDEASVSKQDLFVCGEYAGTEKYLVCRRCKGFLVEAKICSACERVYIELDEHICDNCWNDAQTLENCLEIGGGECMDEQVSLNGFLASVYSKADIERILIKDFKTNITLDKENEHIYKYLDDDREFLADWLAEKREKHNVNLH